MRMMQAKKDDLLAGIGRYLFYNPWSTADLIGGLVSDSHNTQLILANSVYFEQISIFRRGGKLQRVYGLTAEGQRELAGSYRSPGSLADGLLLGYDRLEEARRVVLQLKSEGICQWSISPWRPSRRSPYYDALIGLQGKAGLVLAGLLEPPYPSSLAWYQVVLERWKMWRRSQGEIPAVLVYLNARLDSTARSYLIALAGTQAGCAIHFLDGEEMGRIDRWKAYIDQASRKHAAWLPSGSLLPGAFFGESRTTAYSQGVTLQYWVQKNPTEPARLTAFFLQSEPGEMELLDLAARFPGLSVKEYQGYFHSGADPETFAARSEKLLAAGFLAASGSGEEGYLLTRRGLAFLARRMGLGVEAANRCLGWPVRKGAFRSIRLHQSALTAFMLRLLRENLLAAWDYNSARYEFRVARHAFGSTIRKLVIAPDSAGLLWVGMDRYRLFWLEIDRGTRRGRRLEWKLEKYFLAHFALTAPTPIPPVWYLVDPPSGNGEARLRSVAEKLVSLGRKHPGTRLRVLLTTGSLFRSVSGRMLEARIWRQFRDDRFSPELVSLLAGFE